MFTGIFNSLSILRLNKERILDYSCLLKVVTGGGGDHAVEFLQIVEVAHDHYVFAGFARSQQVQLIAVTVLTDSYGDTLKWQMIKL